MWYLFAVLALCANIGAALSHPVCPNNTGCELNKCSPIDDGATLCFYTISEYGTVIITYRPQKKFHLKCQNEIKIPIDIDNSKLPVWTTHIHVEEVEIENCLASLNTSYYNTLYNKWNVTVTKSLILNEQYSNPKLEELNLRGLSIQELVIYGQDPNDPPRPSENYLDGIKGLSSLKLLRVVLDSKALMRLPVTLENLTLEYACVPEAVNSLGNGSSWLERLNNLKYLYLRENVAAALTLPEFNGRKLTTLRLNKIFLNSSSLIGKFKNSSIENLELFSCGLDSLPDRLFEGANKLKELVINDHNLNISAGTFSPLQWLTKLDLTSNNLNGATLLDAVSSLPRLQHLIAYKNPLGSLCNESDSMSVKAIWPKSLLRLELRETKATRICPEWIENEALEGIDLDNNDIGNLTFSDLKMRRALGQTVNLNLTGNPNLRFVNASKEDILQCHGELPSSKDFNNRTRAKVKLKIDMSKVTCDNGAYWLREALRNCPSWLELADIYLDTSEVLCRYDDCLPECLCHHRPHDNALVVKCLGEGTLPMPLSPQWQKMAKEYPLALHVAPKKLNAVPNVTFVELHAPNNNISELDVSDISDTLLILDIRNNSIKHISEVVARKLSAKGTNRSVRLKGNWLDCTCSDEAAYKLLSSNNVVLDWNETLCMDSIHVTEKMRDGLCFPVYYIILILIGLGLILLNLGLLLHCYKLQIRKVLFRLNWCRRYIFRVKDDTEKEKDVFLSYYHKDLEQLNVIKNALESRGYSTIEHNRDFKPGDPILSQIDDLVQKARRTLVLLSDNFLQSAWMPYEFRLAHTHALRHQTSKVVIIRYNLSQVAIDMLPSDLRFYIKHHTYLDLQDEKFWEKLYGDLGMPRFQIGYHNDHMEFEV